MVVMKSIFTEPKYMIPIAVVVGIVMVAVLASPLSPILAYAGHGGMSWYAGKTADINVTGSANLGEAIKNFIEENRDISFSTAATTAQNELADTKIVGGHFGVIQGYLVYTFMGVDNEQQISKLIVDAADGTVLYESDPIQINGHGKFYPANVTAELDLSEAAVKAQAAVENGGVEMGMLRVQDDKPVYIFLVTDDEQGTKQFVTVDADSGEVLQVSEGMPGGFYGKHFGGPGYGKGWHGHGHGWYGHGYEDRSDKDQSSSDANTDTGSQA
jgi:uncharacterized membrane protein YkoI